MEMETTAKAHAALPKAKQLKLAWTQNDKSNWSAPVPDEKLPARIRELDKKTFSCFRDGKYLGSEPTMDDAKKRVVLNQQSEKNRTMRAWEQAHPNELPPFLRLTEAERAMYWERHPPQRAASSVVQAARSISRGDAGNDADPGTRKLRAELARSTPSTGATGNADVAKDATPAERKPRTNKDQIIAGLLKKGCTREEVLKATGWTAVSMQQQAKQIGAGLVVDKNSRPFRYKSK